MRSRSAGVETLPATAELTAEGDPAAEMVAGIDRFLTRETGAALERRGRHWRRELSSAEAYAGSVAPNRERLRRILGVIDAREEVTEPELVASLSKPALRSMGSGYHVLAIRWPVLPGVEGDGLLLQPDRPLGPDVIALPDCDNTPEQLAGLEPGLPGEAQFARQLAEAGCRVLIPTLIDRSDTDSGHADVRMTNQPHREFIWRGAFEMGRHIIGYEVQKILALVDWLVRLPGERRRIGVAGYGEGGLLALYSAAVDERIDAALVSGYFRSRQQVWEEPIYRSVWGLLDEFGDAELASLVAPRALIIEASRHPEISGPPPVREGRSGAAPGRLTTPPLAEVEAEFRRAREVTARLNPPPALHLVAVDGRCGSPGSDEALALFLQASGARREALESSRQTADAKQGDEFNGQFLAGGPRAEPRVYTGPNPAPASGYPASYQIGEEPGVDSTGPISQQSGATGMFATGAGRQAFAKRAFEQLVEYNQRLMREGEFRRSQFWSRADPSDPEKWRKSCISYRDYFWEEVIGHFPPASLDANPRTRPVYDVPSYTGYEVVLDVWPDVFAYGILLLPKGIAPGERRPVVVCQHGLEGRPQDVADPRVNHPGYHQFACQLAERGFVTFSPQNPYIGEERFRVLQRKARPLKKSLFAVIVRQHERILEWLAGQPFVDPNRIAFYGLSYGGKTAMRVPALLEGYCLSICSADFNEWIWKNVSTRHRYSYMFTNEYDMYEFDLGNTFNYAEMSGLICPRPFMVERGHDDGVAPDEWVAYEFAKTRRLYDQLGLGDRAELEVFNGPHMIHGVGTFEFLHDHLDWPSPEKEASR